MKPNKKALIVNIILALAVFLITVVTLQFINKEELGKLHFEYTILKEEYSAKKNKLLLFEKQRKIEKDSLMRVILEREKANLDLIAKGKSLEKEVINIRDREIKIPENITDMVSYYNTRYSTKENEAIKDKVGLGLNTSSLVSYELEKGDDNAKIITLRENQLILKDGIIDNLTKDKKDLSFVLNSAEEQILIQKDLQTKADENIESLSKQLKVVKRKNTLNKILLPVGIAVGGFIGYSVAK